MSGGERRVVCHAPGDRCLGCAHYRGEAPVCECADKPKRPPQDPRRFSFEALIIYPDGSETEATTVANSTAEALCNVVGDELDDGLTPRAVRILRAELREPAPPAYLANLFNPPRVGYSVEFDAGGFGVIIKPIEE